MKKILFSLLISASATLFAQQNTTLVVADGMLASAYFLKTNAKNIKTQKTYAKNIALPQSLSNFSDTAKSSLISVNLKDNYYDKISLADMNLQFNLEPTSPVLYDGFLFKNTEILILGDVLKKADLKMFEGKEILRIYSDPKL